MNYATLDELKRKLKEKQANTVNDTFLSECLERASRWIDRYTNSFFYTKIITEEIVDVHGYSENGLKVVKNVIISPTRIQRDQPITIIESGVTLIKDDDFYVYPMDFTKTTNWTTEFQSIKITATLGYATTPEVIQLACLDVAQVFSGLGVGMVQDDSDIEAFIRKSIPKFVYTTLEMWVNRYA